MSDGTCMRIWSCMYGAAPTDFVAMLSLLVCSPERLEAQNVEAKAFGKEVFSPTLGEVRLIMPLPPLLQLADWLVSRAFREWLLKHVQVPDSCYLGGRSGTQVSDVVSAVAQSLAKSTDVGRAVWWVQADVRQYYDRIEVGMVCRWLLHRGVSGWLRAAVFMLQMCCQVNVRVAGAVAGLMRRGRGSLTGSRVAGMCGMAIMMDVCEQLHRIARPNEVDGVPASACELD